MPTLDLPARFSTLDWGIVAVYLAGTVAIGLLVNRYVARMADFVVAGRSLRAALSIATMVGSELGLVTVMYAAQKGFTGGFAAFHIGLAAGVVTLIVGLTGFIVVRLRELGVMTIPEALLAGTLAVLGLSVVQDALGLSALEERLGVELDAARIGLAVTALALVAMVAGSLLFPDRPEAATAEAEG